MYIITILTVETNEVEIIDAFNDELVAQNNYLNKVAELSSEDALENVRESLFVSKTKTNIYTRSAGWVRNGKELFKIVTLHHIPDYDIQDA